MAELEKMRAAGLLVWKILEEMRSMVKEGVSTYGFGSSRGADDEGRGSAVGL